MSNPTTELMLFVYEETINQKENGRTYLGMSEIGVECELKPWLTFRKVSSHTFPAKTLVKFDDGYYSEEVTAKRLRLNRHIELITDNAHGEQIGYSDIGGHFRGHVDGLIRGTVQCGDEQLIWEHKCVDQKDFRALGRLIERKGEENALREWRNVYYVQAQLYMYYSGLEKHFMTVATSGSREYMELITPFDRGVAQKYITLARDLITSDAMPSPINSDLKYPCNICNHADFCHNNKLPDINCRTCISSEAVVGDGDDALWWCHRHDKKLTIEDQKDGCKDHLYHPLLLSFYATQIDYSDDSVTYERKSDFKLFTNGLGKDEFRSRELLFFLTEEKK